MIPIGNICEHDSLNQKPQITEEEDRPFPGAVSFSSDGSPKIQDVPTVMQLNDQKHSHDVDNFKNKTGKCLSWGYGLGRYCGRNLSY